MDDVFKIYAEKLNEAYEATRRNVARKKLRLRWKKR